MIESRRFSPSYPTVYPLQELILPLVTTNTNQRKRLHGYSCNHVTAEDKKQSKIHCNILLYNILQTIINNQNNKMVTWLQL